jgi:hypothetical protein
MDSSLSWRLDGTHNAGVTTINLQSATLAVGANMGYVILDPYTVEAEIRKVTAVTSTTFTVAATTYAHADGDVVFWFDGGMVPWNWFGGKEGSTSFASGNVTAFNRLSQQIYDMGNARAQGILIPPGQWYVNDELIIERDQELSGLGPGPSAIFAVSGFPFDDTGEVCIIHPHRDGVPVSYAAAGPSGRWYFKNFYVSGGGLANSNGILHSPQQPDHTENVRVDNCLGLYGYCLTDVQQHIMTNVEFVNNNISLRGRNIAEFVWIRGFNSEQADTNDVLWEGGGSHVKFDGVHLETVLPLTHMDLRELQCFEVENCWSSNANTGTLFQFSGNSGQEWKAAVYDLKNVRANTPSSDFLIVDDQDRDYQLNAWEARRMAPRIMSPNHNLISSGGNPGSSNALGHPAIRMPGLGGRAMSLGASLGGSTSNTFPKAANFYSRSAGSGDRHIYLEDSSNGELFVVKGDGVSVGGGATVKKILSATATYDPPSTAADAIWSTTVSVTGATVSNSAARASHQSITTAGWILYASVTAADTVTVTGLNKTGNSVDLASGTLRVVVEQF